jgi:hypothetical protein
MATILVGGPVSEAGRFAIISPLPSLIKLADGKADESFEPPHAVNPVDAVANRHNAHSLFIGRTRYPRYTSELGAS